MIAPPRTSGNRSLNSTSASNSSLSDSCKGPSLLRSIRSGRRRSVLAVRTHSAMDVMRIRL